MVRRLRADEAALWRKVARDVRPLAGAGMTEVVEEPRATGPAIKRGRPPPEPRAPAEVGTTLDSGWDRKLARGRVAPEAVIDLHGHSLASAHARLESALSFALASGRRLLLLVAGKPRSGERGGRGAIRAQLSDWLAASRHAGSIAAIRPAHPRHGGAGALYVVLRRPGRRG